MITKNSSNNRKAEALSQDAVRRSIKLFNTSKEHHIEGKSSWHPEWKSCKCSYCCGNSKLHYGLNIPKDWKAANSWWIIKYGRAKYFRWTNSWLRYFA